MLLQVTNASRNPALFGEGRVADTLDGRFELVALHASLALIRLREAPDAEALAQAFVNALFRRLDSGLREEGVGDLAVPKRMQRLASAFYGRADAYAAALRKDASALQVVLVRYFPGGVKSPTSKLSLASFRSVMAFGNFSGGGLWSAALRTGVAATRSGRRAHD